MVYNINNMHFLVNFNIPGGYQTRVISTDSWNSCVSYCQETGLDFRSITDISNSVISYNSPGTNCYQLNAKDANGLNVSAFVWESNFDNLSKWVDLQNFQSINSLQLSNNSYIII